MSDRGSQFCKYTFNDYSTYFIGTCGLKAKSVSMTQPNPGTVVFEGFKDYMTMTPKSIVLKSTPIKESQKFVCMANNNALQENEGTCFATVGEVGEQPAVMRWTQEECARLHGDWYEGVQIYCPNELQLS